MAEKGYNLRRISFSEIREIGEENSDKGGVVPYVRNGVGMLYANDAALTSILKPGTPYIIEECRMALVRQGSASVTLNMAEVKVEAGSLVFIGKGCVVQPRSASPDFEIYGMMVANERMDAAMRGSGLLPLESNAISVVSKASREQCDFCYRLMGLIWDTIHMEPCPEDTLDSLIRALTLLYLKSKPPQGNEDSTGAGSHGRRQMLDQFIKLVSSNCHEQHGLSFYADKMCITPRYLGTVVKQVSGIGAKEWLDRALCTRAKVMLRHGGKPVADIADALNFPNASFFCKFFKRLTGQTPMEYRREG
ncbi:MAG: helix-turn-helix domain-containing protein [Prevotellaceae bacterium]|nr:helix-turn-helix domain-containing protein [Prevotellaceae bacterium]